MLNYVSVERNRDRLVSITHSLSVYIEYIVVIVLFLVYHFIYHHQHHHHHRALHFTALHQ